MSEYLCPYYSTEVQTLSPPRLSHIYSMSSIPPTCPSSADRQHFRAGVPVLIFRV